MPEKASETSSLETSAARWEVRIAAAQQGSREALGEIFRAVAGLFAGPRPRAVGRAIAGEGQPVGRRSGNAAGGAPRLRDVSAASTRAELVLWVQGILNHRVQTAYRRYRGTSKRNIARETGLHQLDESSQEVRAGHDRAARRVATRS